MINRPFTKLWEGFVEPVSSGNTREHHLSRTLNIILLLLLLWGFGFEIQSTLSRKFLNTGDIFVLIMVGILALAYYLNRRGQFRAATILTLGLFITSTFAFVLLQYLRGSNNFAVLYYLIVAILMSELFFSMRGYLITVTIIMTGLLSISLLDPGAQTIFVFLFIFCALIGFSSYNRRFIEKEQFTMAQKLAHEQSLLSMEQRKSAHLELLEEVGRQVTNSLDEKEILERTLEIVVAKFGFAEATISLLIHADILEVAAISGTQDFGYQRGFQQKTGQGIIGHVAETREAYITSDVSHDPYYFSSAERNGSAIGVPMLDKEDLLGVIYVESVTKDELQADDVQTLQTLANQVATSLQKARLYARAQRHLQVMTTLQSISHAVTSSLDLDEILNNVIQLLKDSFGYTYLSIYLLEEGALYLGAQLGYPDAQIIYEIPINSGVIGRTARNKETQFIHDVSTDSDFLPASYEVKNEIAVPLLKDDNVLGVLNVESKGDVPLTENDVNVLNTLAGSVAVAIDNARLHAEVKLMAMTDVVSGLANRRAFDETLYAEITRASRYSQPISLIILDLDSFKEYNDKWGHPAGDIRLKEIADLLRSNVRDPDMAARYGGEEFAIILPNTSKGGAIRLAERLRVSAESSAPQKADDNCPISGYTISLGVATYPDDATSVEELLLMADNAELMAKRLGKNQVYAANSANKIQRP
jgi:diguanylate cyclase (GGDEF)-like protein